MVRLTKCIDYWCTTPDVAANEASLPILCCIFDLFQCIFWLDNAIVESLAKWLPFGYSVDLYTAHRSTRFYGYLILIVIGNC